MASAAEAVRERIHRVGPIPFDEYVELALYGPGGFYASGGGAGRGRDFLTSPEVGPLFGAVLARALDTWWEELGRPDPYFVAEAAAGTGALCRSVLAAEPACAAALRYVLVERSAALREAHASLAADPPEVALATPAGGGPVVTSLPDLPADRIVGVVLANELLDNLPFAVVERAADGWREIRVAVEDEVRLVEAIVPAAPELAAEAERALPDAAVGTRIPLQRAAREWLSLALGAVDRGRVVLVDYAATTQELATRGADGWLRTYREHGRGGDPLDEPGAQDITCDVAVDQLGWIRTPDADETQADFLRAHGIEALTEAAAAAWRAAAARPDVAALKARSRVNEAAALTDPAGLGAFRVLGWVV